MKENNEKNIGVLYSGGKDSTFACQTLMELGLNVVCLITIFSDNNDSYMLHTPNIQMTNLSSKAMDVPIIIGKSSGIKEQELVDIRQTILEAKDRFQISAIASGAIASRYQKTRIDSIASECGLSVLSPLWGLDQKDHLNNLISKNYKILMTSASCEGLGREWLGRELNQDSLTDLERLSQKYGFNIAFEGGEAETLVLDCPIFKSAIRVLKSSIGWNGYFGSLNIEEAELVGKERRELSS